MSFVWASLFFLHFALGNTERREEEMKKFLYDYASHYSDYLYATEEYYIDNTTLIPTMYTMYTYYEASSMGNSTLPVPKPCWHPDKMA